MVSRQAGKVGEPRSWHSEANSWEKQHFRGTFIKRLGAEKADT